MLTVRVALKERAYDVLIGPGVVRELAGVLPSGVKKVAIVTQPGIGIDVDPGVEHRVFPDRHGGGREVDRDSRRAVSRVRPVGSQPR